MEKMRGKKTHFMDWFLGGHTRTMVKKSTRLNKLAKSRP